MSCVTNQFRFNIDDSVFQISDKCINYDLICFTRISLIFIRPILYTAFDSCLLLGEIFGVSRKFKL